jgi:peroxidase
MAAASAARCSGGRGVVALLLLLVLLAGTGTSSAQLCTSFYSHSCPGVYDTVRSVLQAAIAREQRMGASILRLFFHDCFVQVRTYSNTYSLAPPLISNYYY